MYFLITHSTHRVKTMVGKFPNFRQNLSAFIRGWQLGAVGGTYLPSPAERRETLPKIREFFHHNPDSVRRICDLKLFPESKKHSLPHRAYSPYTYTCTYYAPRNTADPVMSNMSLQPWSETVEHFLLRCITFTNCRYDFESEVAYCLGLLSM